MMVSAMPSKRSMRQRNRPKPARFVAVFGALAASVALYQAATQPWGSVSTEVSAARRRLATECSTARMANEKRLHAAYPGPYMVGDVLTQVEKEYKCPLDEMNDLFKYLATAESCGVPATGTVGAADYDDGDRTSSLGDSNKKGSNKKKCDALGGTYTPSTIDVSDAAKQTAMTTKITSFLTGGTCVTGAAGEYTACTLTGSPATTCPAECFDTTEFTTDWKVALCHLVEGTDRDAPGEEPGTLAAEMVKIMKDWETHDTDANGATGELDSTDFNKLMTKPIFQWGLFLLYVFCTFYLFCGIAIVCDDFFTASLETLSIKFELSEDVAGATFMAAGSSAPELFTSLSSVIVTDECANRSSVGVGTIVGSAIFNILVIIGATCMLAGQVLQLGWKPMVRDTCWYSLSIALLIIFTWPESIDDLKEKMGEAGCCSAEQVADTTNTACTTPCALLSEPQYIKFDSTGDGVADTTSSTGLVTWWEGLIMWVAYLGYIVFMHFNEAILGETADKVTDEEPEDRVRRKSVAGEEEEAEGDKKGDDPEGGNTTAEGEKKEGEDDEEEDDPVDCLGVPKPDELGDKVFTYFSYPWYIFFMITIPDCESDKWKSWYAVSFINSIIWIGVICYGMVEFAILIGQMCDISSTVMGLTVLSAGTSVPDAISSIVVAQRGLGDMAISNALGSNVFDILLGLGFPYFLSALMEGKPVMMCTDDVVVYLVCLVVVLIIVVGTFAAFKFALRPIMGIILISTYVLFFLMAVLRDQGVLDLGLACDAGH